MGRQLAELTAALQRAQASHREMQVALSASQERTQRLEAQLLQMQMGQAGSTAAPAGGTASSAAPPAVAAGSVSPVQLGFGSFTGQLKGVDLLKQAIKPPKPLKNQDDWERFVWQLETYAALVDSSFPGHLEEARREGDDADETVESEEYRQLSVKLFGMLVSLVSLVSECAPALKIARGIRHQDGFLLWRQLWREFHPEQANRGLIWRRALLSPKFPSKEGEFSAALQEWESDLAKYEAEFGVEKAISDEDKRALLMVESPSALKQHLAMTAGKLTKYEDVRGLVVSYLQAKRVWTPSGAYAQPAGRRHHDPDAMDIGKVGDAKGKDPKGKGKGKGQRRKRQRKGQKGQGRKREGHPKGKGKGEMPNLLAHRPHCEGVLVQRQRQGKRSPAERRGARSQRRRCLSTFCGAFRVGRGKHRHHGCYNEAGGETHLRPEDADPCRVWRAPGLPFGGHGCDRVCVQARHLP